MDFQTKVLVAMAVAVGVAFIGLVLWVVTQPEEKRLPNRWREDD